MYCILKNESVQNDKIGVQDILSTMCKIAFGMWGRDEEGADKNDIIRVVGFFLQRIIIASLTLVK